MIVDGYGKDGQWVMVAVIIEVGILRSVIQCDYLENLLNLKTA